MYKYVEYPGDFWSRIKCVFIGHSWFPAGNGRYCNRCWRVESIK